MSIKYLTLNMFEGGKQNLELKAFFLKERPDILCLQEVYDTADNSLSERFHSIEVLTGFFPEYSHVYAPELLYHDQGKKYHCGNAIFSRFPIKETKTIFYDLPYGEYERYNGYDLAYDFSKQPYNLLHAELSVGDASLNVFTTHGIWGTHGGDTDRRLAMGDTIINQIVDKQHVLLGGDFNLYRNTQTVRNIEEHLDNVFGDTLKTTFNIRKKPHVGNYATSVVDMLFVSHDIVIKKKSCPDVDVSDHFPLLAEFELAR